MSRVTWVVLMQLIHFAHELMRPAPARPDQKNRLPNFLGTADDPQMGLSHDLRRNRRRNSGNPQAPRGEALQERAILDAPHDMRPHTLAREPRLNRLSK